MSAVARALVSEMSNDGSAIVHYQSLTNPALGSFTNAEAAGGPAIAVEVTELAGKPTHLKVPKDGSGIARCTMTVTGNGQDDVYPYNCVFSGYPTTTSFQELIDLDGAAVFDHGRQQLKVKLCPSDCSPTPGHSTLTWSFQRIVAQ